MAAGITAIIGMIAALQTQGIDLRPWAEIGARATENTARIIEHDRAGRASELAIVEDEIFTYHEDGIKVPPHWVRRKVDLEQQIKKLNRELQDLR